MFVINKEKLKKNTKISYIFKKETVIFLLFTVSAVMNIKNMQRRGSIVILKVIGLTNNIEEYQ